MIGTTSPSGNSAPRPLSELGQRIGSAVVLAAVALATTWLGGWIFTALWTAAGIAILIEWIDMTRARHRLALIGLGSAGLLVFVAMMRLDPDPGRLALVAGGTLAALALAGASWRDRGWAMAGIVYAGMAAVVPILLRDRPDLGAPAILWIFAVVWSTDIGAFFVGRRFGGPKLWRAVSPGKTWSGFAGGLVAGTLAGIAVAWLTSLNGHALPVGWSAILVSSALASVASQLGDLAESAMKRLFCVKDSGHLIPGHGGFMDRLDGFVAAAFLLGILLLGGLLGGSLLEAHA